MTEILQVGDIVTVNELTPEMKRMRDTHHYGLDNRIHEYIGKHAVVVSVRDEDSGVVSLIPCEPEYQYTFTDVCQDQLDAVETIPNHLTLVRKSPLRMWVIPSGVGAPILQGKRVPMLCDDLDLPFTDLTNGKVQTIKAPVIGVYTMGNEVMVEIWYKPDTSIHTIYIPVNNVDSQSVFTVF